MKNFYQYLAPFAPDYSGAAAVFLETGALIVICDPGGCSGNVCGYDEPRFFREGAAIYSAAMRDLDTIYGTDDSLVDKICSAASYGDFPMIALIGTPVVSVIATDLEAICRMIEDRTGIPAVSVDTNGMDYYDVGEKKARKVIERRFSGAYTLGPTPLDSVPSDADAEGIAEELAGRLTDREGKVLIIHQKDAAEKVRACLKEKGYVHVDTGSFFKGCDRRFDDEEEFIQECMNYDAVIGDPLYFRALNKFEGEKVAFPHLAVSGDLFMEIG